MFSCALPKRVFNFEKNLMRKTENMDPALVMQMLAKMNGEGGWLRGGSSGRILLAFGVRRFEPCTCPEVIGAMALDGN